jgi:replicative DNA helicase
VVEIQIISKVIESGDYSFIENNLITSEYFEGSGFEDEFNFIQEHYEKYKNVPDKFTFLQKFPDFEITQVTESDQYLLDTLREQYLFVKSRPVVKEIARLLKSDANAAVEYMLNATKTLQPNYSIGGTDLIAQAEKRLDSYKDRLENQDNWYFTSGFEELDDVIHGIKRVAEFLVIFARTNQGKSWVLEKIVTHIWQLGFNVGYISPEMEDDSIGYRFDTLFRNWSNKDLEWGSSELDGYTEYINSLKDYKNKFIVSTPNDFNRRMTVSKLKQFIINHKLDVLAIDGIKYLTDERYKRGDSITTSLTNISEDLMALSIEMRVPILVVHQANRSGAIDSETDGTPDLESIRDSDGISHNASKVLAIRQKDGTLEIGVKKQRIGRVGDSFKYEWDINTGEFTYLMSDGDEAIVRQPRDKTRQRPQTGDTVF